MQRIKLSLSKDGSYSHAVQKKENKKARWGECFGRISVELVFIGSSTDAPYNDRLLFDIKSQAEK